MIAFSEVSKSFDGRMILDKVSFSVDPGEFVCITGPSGAGKSTIVQMLIRACVPSSGSVQVDGVDLAKLPPGVLQLYRRRTGVMFQDYRLLQHLTAEENVAFAMEVCGDPDDLIDARVPEVLTALGLDDCATSFPRELSGGEQARTALARAIVHQPMVLIADEPTGNIDPEQSLQLLELLKAIHQEGVTVVLATHDQAIVDALQTRVIRLEGGKIVRDAVGGYSTPVKQALPEHGKKHLILQESGTEELSVTPVTEEPKPLPKRVQSKKASGDGGQTSGHVKPIAIND